MSSVYRYIRKAWNLRTSSVQTWREPHDEKTYVMKATSWIFMTTPFPEGSSHSPWVRTGVSSMGGREKGQECVSLEGLPSLLPSPRQRRLRRPRGRCRSGSRNFQRAHSGRWVRRNPSTLIRRTFRTALQRGYRDVPWVQVEEKLTIAEVRHGLQYVAVCVQRSRLADSTGRVSSRI